MVDDATVRKFLGIPLDQPILPRHREQVERMINSTRYNELRYKKRRERGKRYRH